MLEELTDTSIEIQRKWIKFMLERVGHNNLPRLMDYYKNIGWISSSAANRLLILASEEKSCSGTSWTLSAEEHRISRLYIEKLKGQHIDDSLFIVPLPGKARLEPVKKIELRPGEDIHQIHPVEKKKMEVTIHRREVTINNLEQELENRDIETGRLKERICELEVELEKCQKEVMRNKIYMEILDQNIKLKKAQRISRKDHGKDHGKK